MPLSTYILCSCIGITVVAGDFIESKLARGWPRAAADNIVHAIVGFISWATFVGLSIPRSSSNINGKLGYLESILCALMASALDVDHFISAASLDLKEATTLKNRPFLHNTSVILLVGIAALLLSKWLMLQATWVMGWMLLAAGLSHHIRDANRHGFWLWPFGSTPPVPYSLCVALQAAFPILLSMIQRLFDPPYHHFKTFAAPSIV